jgi:hypothetical protein
MGKRNPHATRLALLRSDVSIHESWHLGNLEHLQDLILLLWVAFGDSGSYMLCMHGI